VKLLSSLATERSGLFAPLSPLLERIHVHLPWAPLAPAAATLDFLASACVAMSESGQPIHFVPPQDDGQGYEARIWACGEVETRPDNWHDFFNALVWLTFPQAKAALNARHARALLTRQADRGRERDAMTHFDECGVVVVASDRALLELIDAFRWQELFWERRADLAVNLRCFVFGHATYEQLLDPFRGLTAKAVLLEVSEDWLAETLAAQITDIDRRLADALALGAYDDPRALHPLPLMGFPGLTPASEDAAYYEDIWQFRPGRGGSGRSAR
jgi:hypothetical protein